jgi:hypothetical protein
MKRLIDREVRIFLNEINIKICEENIRQIDKWGEQCRSSFEWLAYATEEFGEFAKEMNDWSYGRTDSKNLKKEIIQTMTLLGKIYTMIKKNEEKG